MKLIGKLICKLLGRHAWRRAHKGEDSEIKRCRRCSIERPVKHRVKTEA